MCEDPVLAARVASGEVEVPPPAREGPRLSEWTPIRAALADLLDAMRGQTQATIAATGAKPGKFHPAPRPETALAEAIRANKDREMSEKYSDIVAQFYAPDNESEAT